MTEPTRDRYESRYPPAIDRLLDRCEVEGDCWVYKGPTSRKGYCRLRGRGGQKVFGHRLSWEYFRGEIPGGLTYDHLCFNPPCVNPWHGNLVPVEVNSARQRTGMAAINRTRTHCPQGHPYLTSNLVRSAPGRVCRQCRNDANRRYRARRKERVNANG